MTGQTVSASAIGIETPVVILCGGEGTRIREVSERLPKPMVDIGGYPILWHIMKLYSEHGFRRFILCLGYKGWEIKRYFADYRRTLSDYTSTLSHDDQATFHDARGDERWEITFAETGLETQTGARLRTVRKYIDSDHLLATYGDGIAPVDIHALVSRHLSQGKLGTVTAVHPTSRYGEMQVEGDAVVEFNEKPTKVDGWVSGGFFAFSRRFLDDYLEDDPTLVLEQQPLQRLARDGELSVHRHEAFWMGMDTFRDYTLLNELWTKGQAPWKVWPDQDHAS